MRPTLLLCLILTACASQPSYEWRHPSGDRAKFDKDFAQCQYEAAQATAGYSQGQTARTNSGAFAQGFGEGLEIGARRNELGVLCMKAKGYTQHALR